MNSAKSRTAIIILYLLGLSLLFGLSIWQYLRGVEKQEIAATLADSGLRTLSNAPIDWEEFIYQEAELTGHWLGERSFLLENRIYQGKVGYEVLTPFRLQADGRILLVNRGWVATSTDAPTNAEFEVTKIRGVIYFPEKGLVLGEAILPESSYSKQWPKKSLYIDLPVFARTLNTEIEPVVLVLDSIDPLAFQRIWKAAVMPAKKHFGYAVQWMGLGLTFLIYGVLWFRRRVK